MMTTELKNQLIRQMEEVVNRCQPISRARQQQTESHRESWMPILPGGAPNVLLRSSLFGATSRGNKNLLQKFEVKSTGKDRITYTGPRLDQSDLDVWLAVLELCKHSRPQGSCHTNAATLLALLKRNDDGRNHRLIDRRLSRLKATALEVHAGSHSYEGSLIDECCRDTVTKRYLIKINTRLNALFGPHDWTAIDLHVRLQLAGHPLAQWLHAFFSTHTNPHPYRIETIKHLCGSTNLHITGFKQELKKALITVQNAARAHGQVFDFSVDDKVKVQHSLKRKVKQKAKCRQAPAMSALDRAQTYSLRAGTYDSPCTSIAKPVREHIENNSQICQEPDSKGMKDSGTTPLIVFNHSLITRHQQAQSAQAQPFGPKGAHISGSEANRPIDDKCAKHASRGGRPRPSVSRGQSPGVGAKRSTIQIDGQASSLSPAGASVAMPISAKAETRRAKANSQVGAPAQHPIWMVERCEATTPQGSAKGVQPEQDRLRVQRKGAWRLGLGTKPSFSNHHLYGEHLHCASQRLNQCALRTDGALTKARRGA